MAIEVKKEAAVPEGTHKGIIIDARETTKVFDPQRGPEPVVEITIQPAWKSPDGAATLPVSVLFKPVLNGLSSLSKFLERIGETPSGKRWEASQLHGTEVEFFAKHGGNGFVQVVKDSIQVPA